MSKRIEERLHAAAQTERTLGHYELEQMLLDAADTILELHVRLTHMELHECPGCKNVADLQEALDENAELRELMLDMLLYYAMPGAPDYKREAGLLERAHEMGIEASE